MMAALIGVVGLAVGVWILWRLEARGRRKAEKERDFATGLLTRERDVRAVAEASDRRRTEAAEAHAAKQAEIAAQLRAIEEKRKATADEIAKVRAGGKEGVKSLASLLDREKP